MVKNVLLLGIFLACILTGQTNTTNRPRVITAYGDATVPVKPDMAQINVGVITQAATANDAAGRNADTANAVIAAIRNVLGATADVRTISYSLSPNYLYPPNGGQPALTGFTATNIVQATINDLSLIGRVLDIAIQAGANRVDSLQLGLKDEDPVRAQALRAAAQKARVKADAIASGLGGRTGAVLSVQEGVQAIPVIYPTGAAGGAGAAAATPVVTGTVDIRVSVTLQVELQ